MWYHLRIQLLKSKNYFSLTVFSKCFCQPRLSREPQVWGIRCLWCVWSWLLLFLEPLIREYYITLTRQEPTNTNVEHLNLYKRTRLLTVTSFNLKKIYCSWQEEICCVYSIVLLVSTKLSVSWLGWWVNLLCKCQSPVRLQMAAGADNSLQWGMLAASLTFHHQKSFPLFNSASAAYFRGRMDSQNVYDATHSAWEKHKLLGFFSMDHSLHCFKVTECSGCGAVLINLRYDSLVHFEMGPSPHLNRSSESHFI